MCLANLMGDDMWGGRQHGNFRGEGRSGFWMFLVKAKILSICFFFLNFPVASLGGGFTYVFYIFLNVPP